MKVMFNYFSFQSPFYYMSLRMQDVTGDGGVLKEVLRHGSGRIIPLTASVSGTVNHGVF